MLSVKNSSSKYYSTLQGSQTVKSSTGKAITLDDLSTESQQERIKKLLAEVKKGTCTSPNALLISQTELNRIRGAAAITSKEQILQQKRLQEEQAEKQHAAAKARKQRMLEIEAQKRNDTPDEAEMERTMKNETISARAKLLMNEDLDDVKLMNKMMLYSKVVTIRDKQLQEKKNLHNVMKDEEKRKDLMMEIDRLKKIKFYEDQENVKRDQQRSSALEIVDQIKVRELERLKEQEEREREGQDMVKYIKQLQKDDAVTALAKKQQQKVVLDAILESNHKAIQNKQVKIIEEKEEEEKIVRYNIEKAQKDAEYQAELKRIKDEKEREIQRLRELQERAQDRQSEIDGLRAKRASELADRLAREKERKELEQKARINQELLEARKLQSLEKEQRLLEQARQEKDEFERIIDAQKVQRDHEVDIVNEKALRMKEHADQLKKQIAINEEKKKLEKKEFLEEGKKIRDKLKGERNLLETIKQDKLSQLYDAGIEDKYTAELKRKKINF